MRRSTTGRAGSWLGWVLLGALLCLATPVRLWAGGLEQARSGLSALRTGAYGKAVALLTQAIDSGDLPQDETYRFLTARGLARAARGDSKGAIRDYDAALAEHPGYAPALYNRGNAHYRLHRYDLAIRDYSAVLAHHPTDVRALNNRGAAWFRKGNLQSAQANYTRAAQLAPDDIDVLLNRGKLYEALGQPDKARDMFLRIKQVDPSARTPLD